jgi:hypothetical protein
MVRSHLADNKVVRGWQCVCAPTHDAILTRQNFFSPDLHPDDGLHGYFGPRNADGVWRQVDRLQDSEGALLGDFLVADGMGLCALWTMFLITLIAAIGSSPPPTPSPPPPSLSLSLSLSLSMHTFLILHNQRSWHAGY